MWYAELVLANGILGKISSPQVSCVGCSLAILLELPIQLLPTLSESASVKAPVMILPSCI